MLVRYFGAAKAAAGLEEETLPAAGFSGTSGGATLQDLLEFLGARHVTAPDGTPR
ncbi:MoaD/ThiS family protein [Arthrobacter sp. ATA002]|uniref:MoaD/ThiS family protein n=1 Tax=Arthrobacter sp. ATA002 TaxID=2991715 RepID=UPI003FA4338D